MEFDAAAINKLKISVGIFNVSVAQKPGISDIVCTLVDLPEDYLNIFQEEDSLVVKPTKESKSARNFFYKNDKNSKKLKIQIPEGKTFHSIKIVAGIGITKIKNLTTDKLKLYCGVGLCTVMGVTAKEKAKIEGAIGKADIKESSLHNATFSGGVGTIVFNGVLTGDIDISSGVGKVDMTIYGNKSDYNIKVAKNKLFGGIYIDGSTADSQICPQAENNMTLECSIGALEIRFKKDAAAEEHSSSDTSN